MAIADVPRRALSTTELAHAPDVDLVDAAQSGDSAAFGELYRRHFPAVLRACQRRAPGAGDDIAQAAFLRALDRIDLCGGDRRFGAWVQTIAVRMCADHHRSSAKIDDSEWDFDRFASSRRDSSPEGELLATEQRHHLVAALAALPDRQREVIRSRDVEERRPPEIAAALGVSVAAVDSVLLRARRRVADAYRNLSAETGAASVGTTTSTALTSAGALSHRPIAGFVARVANSVATAARDVAARVMGSPLGHVVASPRPGAGLAALAVAIGALAGGSGGQQDPSAPVAVPPVEVSVPAPPADLEIPPPPGTATLPAAPSTPLPGAPATPEAPAIPDQPAPPAVDLPVPVPDPVVSVVEQVTAVADDLTAGLVEEILR